MDHDCDWLDDDLSEIARELAEELGMTPPRFIRHLLFQKLVVEPGVTILPKLSLIDCHGTRGLNWEPVIP